MARTRKQTLGNKVLSILGTSDKQRLADAKHATRPKVGDATDKESQKSKRARSTISLSNISMTGVPDIVARNQRIINAFGFDPNFQGPISSKELQRKFRNEQRNIGRDITATKRDMKKAERGSAEYLNLDAHLRSLESLQRLMRSRNKDQNGNWRYNPASTRMEAYETYVDDFKGKSAREQARTKVQPIRAFVGDEEFRNRVITKISRGLSGKEDDSTTPWWLEDESDLPEPTDKALEDMWNELDEMIKDYDSAGATAVVYRMMEYKNEITVRRPSERFTSRFRTFA